MMTGRVHHHQLRQPPLLLCLQGNPDFSTLGVEISKAVHVARNMYLSLTSRSFAAVLRAPVRRMSSRRPGVDDMSRSIAQDVRFISSPARAHSPQRASLASNTPLRDCHFLPEGRN